MNTVLNHEATLRGVLDAFARGDLATAIEFYDADATILQYADPPAEHSGRAAIEELLRDVAEQSSDTTFEVVNVVEDGDRLAAEVLMRSTPTDQTEQAEVRYGVFMEFHNDKIRVERLYPSAA